MNTQKLLALLLSVLMLFSAMAVTVFADGTAEAADPAAEALSVQDYQAAFDNIFRYYPPKTPVFTAEGITVTWDMFSYWLINNIYNGYGMYIYYMGGLPTDLSADEESLYDETVKQCNYFLMPYVEAEREGLTLSPEQQQKLDDSLASLEATYGSREKVLEAMEQSWLTEDVYTGMMAYSLAMTNLMNAHVGENGEKLSAEDVVAWAEEAGFTHTKHILFEYPTVPRAETDENGKTVESEEYTAALAQYEEEKAAVLARAQDVAAELRELDLKGEALEAEFDKIMNAETEDPGIANYPDGYTYTAGTMVAPFEEAAFALEPYAISDVVETDYGCHILMALPLDSESVTQEQNASTGEYLTLRQSAALDKFNSEIVELINGSEVTWELELLPINDYTAGNGSAAQKGSGEKNSKVIAVVILAALAAAVAVVVLILRKKPMELTEETAAPASEAPAEETAGETAEEAASETAEAPAEEEKAEE